MKSSIFWDIMPCSPLKVNRRFGGNCRLHLECRRISQGRKQRSAYDQVFIQVSCLAYLSTLKMEAVYSSETFFDIQQTTRRYIPEDRTLKITYIPSNFVIDILLND
jgi:hypothetical protein